LVGVFLILLGIYGFFNAIRRRRHQNSTMTNPIKLETEVANAVDNNLKDTNSENSTVEKDALPGINKCTSTGGITEPTETSPHPSSGSATAQEETKQSAEMEHRQQALEEGELPSTDIQNLTSRTVAEQISVHGTSTTRKERNCRIKIIRREQIMSFLVGILHGVAGPGGVLGILPAAQLQNLSLAYAYLASFCISSIIIMGIFASLFGTLTHKLSQITQLEFQIECFSAGVCTLIGTVWLSLSIAGKLGDIF
jgi:magnesium-transporting ATPase (P-type)